MYGGTVSRCVESVTPPPARDAQTLPRPGETSCTVTFHPRRDEPAGDEIDGRPFAAGRRLDGEQFGGERDDVGHARKSSGTGAPGATRAVRS